MHSLLIDQFHHCASVATGCNPMLWTAESLKRALNNPIVPIAGRAPYFVTSWLLASWSLLLSLSGFVVCWPTQSSRCSNAFIPFKSTFLFLYWFTATDSHALIHYQETPFRPFAIEHCWLYNACDAQKHTTPHSILPLPDQHTLAVCYRISAPLATFIWQE